MGQEKLLVTVKGFSTSVKLVLKTTSTATFSVKVVVLVYQIVYQKCMFYFYIYILVNNSQDVE